MRKPDEGQTPEQVEAWLRAHVRVGAVVAVRETQYHLLKYTLTEVDYTGTKGRFSTKQFGSFYFSGKNCFYPKGQTRLVIPTPEVLEFIQQHPQGVSTLWEAT